jgi:phosphatidate cytidylyltransferase
MIRIIYLVILTYFLIGFIGFYFINRKKKPADARITWIKYGTYFIIIHLLFLSIVFFPVLFRVLAVTIIAGSFYELQHVYKKSESANLYFFIASVGILGIVSTGFYVFSGLNAHLVLFSFLIVSIFDSFSQIAGQLWGKRKLFPKISPQKTAEGVIGGVLIALVSSYLLRTIVNGSHFYSVRLATGIIAFAFLGDMIASFYKRKFNVKDYSNFIPGHGGFLDRFDSLIAGGTFITLNEFIFS